MTEAGMPKRSFKFGR